MVMRRRAPGLIALAAILTLTAAACGTGGPLASDMPMAQRGSPLKPPAAFSSIDAPAERSGAMFLEAGRVLLHPRCVNCHPAGNVPLQGDDSHLHQPTVQRGAYGLGVPGLECPACHQSANYDAVGVPGNPAWRLAPASMAWQGRSLAEICAQIKDPARNGGRSLDEIVKHVTEDSLVGWAWAPGAGREPVPGTQQSFGTLIRAWADSGAVCPR